MSGSVSLSSILSNFLCFLGGRFLSMAALSRHDPAPCLDPLPDGCLRVRPGPGANCSAAGSTIDILFYGSLAIGALAIAIVAWIPPRDPSEDENEVENHEDPR